MLRNWLTASDASVFPKVEVDNLRLEVDARSWHYEEQSLASIAKVGQVLFPSAVTVTQMGALEKPKPLKQGLFSLTLMKTEVSHIVKLKCSCCRGCP